ncbi:MAG: alanine racemase [Gemmatimonadota bacterium]
MGPQDLVGQPREALDTPVLLVDREVLERNIQHMKRVIVDEAGVRWRPHTKGMKTPALAHLLQRQGARGITCAKLAEAEVMAHAGIDDILIANQIVGPQKAERLACLQGFARVMACVDGEANVRELGAAARARGLEIPVLVEVDVGMQRAGTQPGAPTVRLAEAIDSEPGLQLQGLMTWEAPAAREPTDEARKAKSAQMLGSLTDSAEACRRKGLNMEILSCSGTLTYWYSAFHPGITEVQAGGGIYGDTMYCQQFGIRHEYALTVMSTVTSRPTGTRIICDAGKKTMTSDMGVPQPLGVGAVARQSLSAEHGLIELAAPCGRPAVGERLEWVVGYSDTTVALHDALVVTRQGRVEAVWPLLGRGKLT